METDCINPQLYDALSKQIGQGYNQEKGREVVNAVHNTLINALGSEDSKILPDAGLASTLGAESIDGLDISLRLTKQLGIIIPKPYANILLKESEQDPAEKTVIELTIKAYELYIKR